MRFSRCNQFDASHESDLALLIYADWEFGYGDIGFGICFGGREGEIKPMQMLPFDYSLDSLQKRV